MDQCIHDYLQYQWDYNNIDQFLRQDVLHNYCSDAFLQFRHSLHYGYACCTPVPNDPGEAQASLEASSEFSHRDASNTVSGNVNAHGAKVHYLCPIIKNPKARSGIHKHLRLAKAADGKNAPPDVHHVPHCDVGTEEVISTSTVKITLPVKSESMAILESSQR